MRIYQDGLAQQGWSCLTPTAREMVTFVVSASLPVPLVDTIDALALASIDWAYAQEPPPARAETRRRGAAAALTDF